MQATVLLYGSAQGRSYVMDLQCDLQGWAVCAVYCLDAQFASDVAKFVAGSLQALSAMVLLELPHHNVLTKVDLLTPESKVRSYTY